MGSPTGYQAPPYPSAPYRPAYQPGSYGQPMRSPQTVASGGRIARGLRLVRTGFTIAKDEPGLIAVPIIGCIVQLLIIGAGTIVLWPALHPSSQTTSLPSNGTASSVHLSAEQWVVVALIGFVTMFVSVIAHATMISRVMARFHGQRITNGVAFKAVMSKSPQLLAWSVIDRVVLSVLRSIGRRGILGAIVRMLLQSGWLLASFFVVPVVLFENLGAFAAIKRSASLCRQQWGENIVGNSAIAIIAVLAIIVDVVISIVLGAVFAPLGVVVGVLGLIAILLVVTVASSAFNAALYWYAVTRQSPDPWQYSADDLQSAYRPASRSRSYSL